jgi:hypothetical protein
MSEVLSEEFENTPGHEAWKSLKVEVKGNRRVYRVLVHLGCCLGEVVDLGVEGKGHGVSVNDLAALAIPASR